MGFTEVAMGPLGKSLGEPAGAGALQLGDAPIALQGAQRGLAVPAREDAAGEPFRSILGEHAPQAIDTAAQVLADRFQAPGEDLQRLDIG